MIKNHVQLMNISTLAPHSPCSETLLLSPAIAIHDHISSRRVAKAWHVCAKPQLNFSQRNTVHQAT